MIRHVCVQWPRLGPYHLARLGALHRRLARERVALTALETASGDTTYGWREEAGALPFERVCALPGRALETVRPAETWSAVTAALDRIDADAVAITSYSTPDAQAALAWCRRRRCPAVVMFDSRAEDAARSRPREAVKRALVQSYDAALVAGTPQAAYLASLGMPPSHTFRPVDVVDNARFACPPERTGNPPTVLSVNRFVERKNVATLIRAYGRFRRDGGPAWPLVLVGDGPERAALHALAASEGVPDVQFPGFLQVERLPAVYAQAGVYVHPAAADPWGLVVNEAMAAGRPVLVSTGAGCAPDLVRGNGWTFSPDAPDALAALLGRVAALAPDARADLGRQSQAVIAGYSLDAFAEGLWRAVQAGQSRADRPLSLAACAVLGALRLTARRHQSFHTVDA